MMTEVFRATLFAQIQTNAPKRIGQGFTVQMYDDLKPTVKDVSKVKQFNVLQWPCQSSDLNPVKPVFHLLNVKLNEKHP